MVSKEIDPDEIREFTTDDRGRVNFGRKHANQKVRVAVEYVGEAGEAVTDGGQSVPETVAVEHDGETRDVPTAFTLSDLSAWYGDVPDEIRVDRIFIHDDVVRAEMHVEGEDWVEVGYFTEEDFRPGTDTGWIAQRLDDTTDAEPGDGPGETIWTRDD